MTYLLSAREFCSSVKSWFAVAGYLRVYAAVCHSQLHYGWWINGFAICSNHRHQYLTFLSSPGTRLVCILFSFLFSVTRAC